jgi:hypothetical protein
MEQPKTLSKKLIFVAVMAAFALIVLGFLNPFSWNDATERIVITRMDGTQKAQFTPGMFYSGFFSKEKAYPNQISVSYKMPEADMDLLDNTVEVGKLTIRFSDGPTALTSGIVQYILPDQEAAMIAIHNAHRSPEGLVVKRLAPYTVECLQNSAQLMSSEMHYSGGRAQMAQDYLDQLRNGAFLLRVQEVNTFDSLEGTNKKVYASEITFDKQGQPRRKFSSIKEYNITVADAQVTDVDYADAVDKLLEKKIAAATEASVSKQRLMTAQQQSLTAEAEGKKKLVEIEYQQKQEQTKQVVAAQTLVEVAKQDLQKQEIARQAAEKEAAKIKTLADAEAYAKKRVMDADGALEKKLEAYKAVQHYWAEAFANYGGNIVPTYQTGAGGSGNGATQFMEIMGMKAARDLNLDLKAK